MALKNISPYELGATLYMPILKPDALDYIAGTKIPKLRSMVLCLEDALLENDVLEGMNILEKTLIRIGQVKRDSTETRFPLGCCHVKFLWLERSAARGYSGDTGRNFPCIERLRADGSELFARRGDGTELKKQLRVAECMETNRCNVPGDRWPCMVVPVFETADGCSRPDY